MAKGKEPKPESKKKATKTLIEKRKEKQEKKANKQYLNRHLKLAFQQNLLKNPNALKLWGFFYWEHFF